MHSGRECNNTHYNIVLSSALGASNVDAAKAKVVAFILVLLLLLLLFALRIWENYRLRLCVVTDIKVGELGLFGNFGAFQFHWFGVIRKGDDLCQTQPVIFVLFHFQPQTFIHSTTTCLFDFTKHVVIISKNLSSFFGPLISMRVWSWGLSCVL